MIRFTVNSEYRTRTILYLLMTAVTWAVLVFSVLGQLRIYENGKIYALFWFFGYAALSFTAANAFVTYLAYLFVKAPSPLPELDHTPENKSVAISCPVKNEDVGLYERLKFSLTGNTGPHIDFWLLSDSDEDQEGRELGIVRRLRKDFNADNIYYRRRSEHVDFKPGNIFEWLLCHGGADYDYFFTLDADCIVMPGTIEKLLRKAEHPANRRIWLFQCKTAIIHDFTHFAHIQKIGLEIHERLVFPTIYAICGQWISYGHSNFMNTRGFIMANPPTAELSHDIWDAAALDEACHCAVIATDCMVYEEAPANFLIAHKRDKRWTQGSLSALKIIVNNKVSIVERFFVLIGGLQFLNNAIFLPWIILQFCNMVLWNCSSIQFTMDFSIGRYAMNGTLLFVTVFSIGTFLFHPFLVAKNLKDVRSYIWYLFFANLTIMTNLVNGCYNCLSVLISPKHAWVPMEKNPFARSPVFNILNKTVPTSAISLILFILAWQSRHVFWIVFTSPVLLGGIGSPIIMWWSGTARRVEEKGIDLSALDVKTTTTPSIRRDVVTVEV